jgi:hypothetical protein
LTDQTNEDELRIDKDKGNAAHQGRRIVGRRIVPVAVSRTADNRLRFVRARMARERLNGVRRQEGRVLPLVLNGQGMARADENDEAGRC